MLFRSMAGSPMKFRIRTQLIELAYRATLRRLRERHHVYKMILSRYGFILADSEELLKLEKTNAEVFESIA